MRFGIIGIGHMGEAILRSVLHNEVFSLQDVFIADKDEAKVQKLANELAINVCADNAELVAKSDAIVLAVKPDVMPAVLDEITNEATEKKLIISVAAGFPIAKIEEKLSGARVARVMPNQSIKVNEGAGAYCIADNIGAEDEETIKQIFAGRLIHVGEELMHAVTAISSSGSGFCAYLIDAFIEAGLKNGLTEEQAAVLAEQTFLGTGKLLLDEGIKPKELITKLSTSGGTTEQGMNVLKESDLKEIISSTIEKAIAKSKEISKEMS